MTKKIFITGELGMTAIELDRIFSDDPNYTVIWGRSNRELSECTFNSVYGQGKELDICDIDYLEYNIKRRRPDIIIHLAGIVGTDLCNKMPEQAFRSNSIGSYNVAMMAKKYGCKLVYFSTTAIYDPKAYSKNDPIKEYTSKSPKTIYGITKYSGELISESIVDNLLVIRPCFVYGGNNDNHSALSKAVKSVILRNKYDIYLDPKYEKDYLYVTDEINAIKMLIDQNKIGDFNISFGDPKPFREYISCVEEVLCGKIDFNYYTETDYLHNHIVDNKKILETGWKPKISLVEGIKLIEKEVMNG